MCLTSITRYPSILSRIKSCDAPRGPDVALLIDGNQIEVRAGGAEIDPMPADSS